jgi:hypothetical protein
MTGFDSKRQAAMDKLVEIQEELGMYDDQKPVQKPVAWISALTGDVTMQNMSHTVSWAALYTTPPAAQPEQEPRNFCPRCGKRTPDLTTIHTCTPPRGLEMT